MKRQTKGGWNKPKKDLNRLLWVLLEVLDDGRARGQGGPEVETFHDRWKEVGAKVEVLRRPFLFYVGSRFGVSQYGAGNVGWNAWKGRGQAPEVPRDPGHQVRLP